MTTGYYHFDTSVDGEFVAVVLKDFWDLHGYLDDSGSEGPFMPDGFYEVSEAMYEHNFASEDDAKLALEAAGFEEKILV